jgi:hypothetical protein
MINYVLIVEHEDGRTRYFGPIESPETAIDAANQYFAYENTPFTVSLTTLSEPSLSNFLEFRKDS